MLDVNIVNMKIIFKDRNGKQIPVVIKVKLKISIKRAKGQGVFNISDDKVMIINKY